MAWEPVPQFRALLSYNLAINKLTDLVTVRDSVVADNPGGKQVCGCITAQPGMRGYACHDLMQFMLAEQP